MNSVKLLFQFGCTESKENYLNLLATNVPEYLSNSDIGIGLKKKNHPVSTMTQLTQLILIGLQIQIQSM